MGRMRVAAMGLLICTAGTLETATNDKRFGIAAVCAAPGFAPALMALDSLQIVGEFEPANYYNFAVFGDTDHDGANEVILTFVPPATFEDWVRILEYVPYGRYVPVHTGPRTVALALM